MRGMVQVEQRRVEVVAVALGSGRVVNGEIAGDFRALEIIVRGNRWQEVALLRINQFLRLRQRGLRGCNRRVGPEGPLDQGVERRGLEQLPPFEGDIAAAHQVLRLAAMNRRRGADLRQRHRRVAGIGRGFRPVEARADGAARGEDVNAHEQRSAAVQLAAHRAVHCAVHCAVHRAASPLRFHQPPPSAWNKAIVSP